MPLVLASVVLDSNSTKKSKTSCANRSVTPLERLAWM